MTISFVQQSVQIADDDGRMSRDWYGYFQDAHQASGHAGSQNPLWEISAATLNGVLVDSTLPPTQATISGVLEGWSFLTAATNTVHAVIPLPNSYVPGSELFPFVQWMPDDDTAGNVRWEFDYIPLGAVATAGPVAQIALENAAIETALTGQYIEGVNADSTTIEDTSLDIGSVLITSLTRNGGHANDTYGGGAILLQYGVKCMRGGVGTVSRWPAVEE